MKTAGQILKQRRIAKGLKIDSVARVTKIRPVYLQALEEDCYQNLPSITSSRGFLKNYAEYLGLDSEMVLAVFRRDFREKKIGGEETELDKGFKFNWTPKFTTILAVGILAIAFIAYLIWQYRSLISAPYY